MAVFQESGARGRTNCLYTAPMHISLFVLSIGYVLVSHCQQARYVHQFVHQYGWAWSTPLPHVYIHRQKHRSVFESVNHYQLPFRSFAWVTDMRIYNASQTGRTWLKKAHWQALASFWINRYRTHTTESVWGLYGVTTQAYWAIQVRRVCEIYGCCFIDTCIWLRSRFLITLSHCICN